MGLMTAGASAQQAVPPKSSAEPQIVRVSRGSTSGMSGAGEKTTIEPRSIHWEREPSSDWEEKGVPPEKRTCAITPQEWDGLRTSIDAKTIAAFTGIQGCGPCVDQPSTWAELDFSDGTKKAVEYDFSHPPAEIAALLRRMNSIAEKCPSELVIMGGTDRPVGTASSARPTTVVDPVYPESAKAAGVHGTVVVYVIVGRAGEVQSVTAADGPEKLRQAAIDAVQQWKWTPQLLNGKPIRFRTHSIVNFELDKKTSLQTK
jgi:TonB family protein